MNRRPEPIVLPVLAIIAMVVIAYVPAMDGGFIWDDRESLIQSPIITAPDGLYRLWFTTDAPDYFPLVYSLFWIEYRLWGENPIPYHVANILFHALASVLVWLVLRRLSVPGAWLSAAIFAVHPVNVESVAWIYQQRTTLPMVFFLLSIVAYLRLEANRRSRWYALSLATFLLALLGKTSVVMLPVVLLILAWWQRTTVSRRDFVRSVPFFVLAVALGAVTAWFQAHRAIAMDVVRTDSFLSRLAGAGWAVWFYLSKALFPAGLTFVYPRWHINASSLVSYLPLAALIACFVVFRMYRRTWGRSCLVGMGYFVITLLPVLGFLNIYFMRFSLVADHWQYISIPGVIALIVGAAVSLSAGRVRWAKSAGVLVLGILLVLTWRQAALYKDEDTIWRDTIARNPSAWLAHYNLGLSYAAQGLPEQAIERFMDTIRYNPSYAEAHSNLGLVYQNEGKLGPAMAHYRKALRLKPRLAEAHGNLANALASTGRFDDAIREYRAAIRLDAGNPVAHNDYAATLIQLRRFDEAARECELALRIRPSYAEAHFNLAVVLFYNGDYPAAWGRMRRAEELGMSPNPAFVDALSSKMREPGVR